MFIVSMTNGQELRIPADSFINEPHTGGIIFINNTGQPITYIPRPQDSIRYIINHEVTIIPNNDKQETSPLRRIQQAAEEFQQVQTSNSVPGTDPRRSF